MRRREFIVLLSGAVVASPLAVHAQSRATIPHMGYLWLGAAGEEDSTKQGLRQGLGDLGYVEGRGIIVDYRYADGHEDRLVALVSQLVGAKVDIILAPGSVVTRAVQNATTTIPVVSTSGDPVGSGFIQSLGRPGGNITGLSLNAGREIAAKNLELLCEIVPNASRIAALFNTSNLQSLVAVQALQRRLKAAALLCCYMRCGTLPICHGVRRYRDGTERCHNSRWRPVVGFPSTTRHRTGCRPIGRRLTVEAAGKLLGLGRRQVPLKVQPLWCLTNAAVNSLLDIPTRNPFPLDLGNL